MGRRRARLVLVLVGAVVLPVGAAVLYTFPPEQAAFYPGCVFRALTGLHCPGCGATRCLHALLHGDLPQALAYNALFVLALPGLAALAVREAYRVWNGQPVGRLLPGWAAWALLGVLLAYGVLRNLPVYPFSELAPHSLG